MTSRRVRVTISRDERIEETEKMKKEASTKTESKLVRRDFKKFMTLSARKKAGKIKRKVYVWEA